MADKADNIMELRCPACGKLMTKVYLPKLDIHLDVCDKGCGGVFLDTREYLKVDEPHEDITPLIEILKDKQFKKADETQTRICPICNNIMVKNYSSAKHQIQVDDCYHCGGKFLDHSELEKIRAEYNTEKERADDVIKEYYNKYGHIKLDLNEKIIPDEQTEIDIPAEDIIIEKQEQDNIYIPEYPINNEEEIYNNNPQITLDSLWQYILFKIYSKR